jgi:hypothetical protein
LKNAQHGFGSLSRTIGDTNREWVQIVERPVFGRHDRRRENPCDQSDWHGLLL